MMAKLSFVSGFAIGLLAGSRIGPRLYTRVASAASSIAANPRVRHGASAAGDKATHAAKAAGTSAAHQVKHAGEVVANRFGDHFGEHRPNGNGISHSTANGSSHGGTGRFDDPLAE
jgi:hypothetical protein